MLTFVVTNIKNLCRSVICNVLLPGLPVFSLVITGAVGAAQVDHFVAHPFLSLYLTNSYNHFTMKKLQNLFNNFPPKQIAFFLSENNLSQSNSIKECKLPKGLKTLQDLFQHHPEVRSAGPLLPRSSPPPPTSAPRVHLPNQVAEVRQTLAHSGLVAASSSNPDHFTNHVLPLICNIDSIM